MPTAARSLLWAATSLVLLGVAVQHADFTAPILTGSNQSMDQYESFRAHLERDGAHDLVVFGNSVARQGVDIRLLREELEQRLGAPFLAFNFGAGGTPPAMLSYMIDLVYGIDRPRYAVIVVTPGLAGAGVREQAGRELRESPYGEALHDPVRWRGALRRWSLDHLSLFSLRYRLKAWLLGRESVPRLPGGYAAAAGFKASKPKENPDDRWDVVSRMMSRWRVTEANVQVLIDATRRLQSDGADVWLVEAPLHPGRVERFPDPDADMERFRNVIRHVAERTGAHYLLLPEDLGFSGADFVDTAHLTPAGAERYTRWLASGLRVEASRPE